MAYNPAHDRSLRLARILRPPSRTRARRRVATAACLGFAAHAQTNPTRELPKDARTGYLTHVVENAFRLDGQRILLSPGGVIRGANNHILMPNTVPKESLVLYTKDPNGNLSRAWVLTRDEAAKVGVASAMPWQTSPEIGTPIGPVLNSNNTQQSATRPCRPASCRPARTRAARTPAARRSPAPRRSFRHPPRHIGPLIAPCRAACTSAPSAAR